ncbi:E-selectin-like isoform X2 [Styela clava]
MTGIGTATCIDQQPNQDNAIGKWDFGDSSCEAVICSNPPTFANGYPSSSCVGDEIFKETCDLKCDQGYYMLGNGIATCEDATTADDNAIGIWDTSGSSCKEHANKSHWINNKKSTTR